MNDNSSTTTQIIRAATITGTDGNTYTLELRPEISLDYGVRYGIYTAETDEGTETSGDWYGGNTFSDDDLELHLTDAHYQMAAWSAMNALTTTWGINWDLELLPN